MRDIPDAPWIGLCRDDYHPYGDEIDEEEEIDWEDEEDDELYG